jgi:hypothetical protein
MKKILTLLLIATCLFATAQKRWVKIGSKDLKTDSTYFQKPIQIGDSIDNVTWIDSICVDDSGDTLFIATSEGIFKAIKEPGSGGFSGDYNDLTNQPSFPDSVTTYETDPIFSASVASGITGTDTTNWNNAAGGGGEVDTSGLPEAGQIAYFTAANKIGGDDSLTRDLFYVDKENMNYGFGRNVFQNNTASRNNTAFGENVLTGDMGGGTDFNSAFGSNSLSNLSGGIYNSAFGASSLSNLLGGSNNSAFGYGSLLDNIYGTGNSAFGRNALENNTEDRNSAFGYVSLINNTSGSNNIGLGYYAGYYSTTQSNRIYINSLNRTNILGDTTLSPIYVYQAATTANQKLYFNGNVNISDDFTVSGNTTLGDNVSDSIISTGILKFPGRLNGQYLIDYDDTKFLTRHSLYTSGLTIHTPPNVGAQKGYLVFATQDDIQLMVIHDRGVEFNKNVELGDGNDTTSVSGTLILNDNFEVRDTSINYESGYQNIKSNPTTGLSFGYDGVGYLVIDPVQNVNRLSGTNVHIKTDNNNEIKINDDSITIKNNSNNANIVIDGVENDIKIKGDIILSSLPQSGTYNLVLKNGTPDTSNLSGGSETDPIYNISVASGISASDTNAYRTGASFAASPSSVITAGTNIDWSGNTLNVTVTGGDADSTFDGIHVSDSGHIGIITTDTLNFKADTVIHAFKKRADGKGESVYLKIGKASDYFLFKTDSGTVYYSVWHIDSLEQALSDSIEAIPAQITTEEIQDIVGGMVSGNTEVNIAITYDDLNGKLNATANAGGGSGTAVDTSLIVNDTLYFLRKYNYYAQYVLADAMDTILIDTTGSHDNGIIQIPVYTTNTDSFRFTSQLPIRMAAIDTFDNIANKVHYYKAELVYNRFINVSLNSGRDTLTADLTPPILDSAVVYDANPDSIELFFSEAVTITTDGWDVDSSGSVQKTISSVGGSGTASPYFLMSANLVGDGVYDITYSSITGSTTDAAGNELVTLTDSSITNHIVVQGGGFADNYSLLLDGTGDYADYQGTDTADYQFSNGVDTDEDFTISFWMKQSATGTTANGVYIEAAATTGSVGVSLGVASTDAYSCYLYGTDNTAYYRRYATSQASTAWKHYMFSYTASSHTISLFANGDSISQFSQSGGTYGALGIKNVRVRIGATIRGNDYFLNGNINDVAIYNVRLGETDAARIYNAGDPIDLSSDANLVGYWTFEQSVEDQSTNANDLTLVGNAQYEADVP